MEKKGNDPTENLKKKPRKSILKSSSSFEVQEQPSGSKRKPLPLPNKLTKFDEQNIKETLHPPNKDYGHMKIEEPKTPYERPIQDEIDSPKGVDPGLLAQKLQQTQQKKKTRGSSGRAGTSRNANQSDSSGDEMTPDKLAKKKEFESRRKAHYNEFLAAKEALKNLKDDEEEEEEEE